MSHIRPQETGTPSLPTPVVVQPGTRVALSQIDTRGETATDKGSAKDRLDQLRQELDDLQELLFAAADQAVLVILQGMDTSGKDGTVRSVFGRVSPLGCNVESFKAPTANELAHDFLWRVHRVTPPRGHITVFNRSHYEDVVVVRVKSLVPEAEWRVRYDHINAFEQMLVQSGTIVLKFFLHISKAEQMERLLQREAEVAKAWKLSADDWRERERWDAYMTAYEDAFARCSPEWAPWHIVPADRKWYRDVVVAETIVNALRRYREGWLAKLGRLGAARRVELDAVRATGG